MTEPIELEIKSERSETPTLLTDLLIPEMNPNKKGNRVKYLYFVWFKSKSISVVGVRIIILKIFLTVI